MKTSAIMSASILRKPGTDVLSSGLWADGLTAQGRETEMKEKENLGLGAMLHILSGGSPKNASDYYGRAIADAVMKEDKLFFKFSDGIEIVIWDNGQSCCERRYMTTDDSLKDLIGDTLVSIAVNTNTSEEGGETHETAFLKIQTNKNAVTVATHNQHNGYYGGFGLSCDEVTGDKRIKA